MPEDELLEAVKVWIRAEYHFRLGAYAYTDEGQRYLIQAEVRLRRLACGCGQLGDAYKAVGGPDQATIATLRAGKQRLASQLPHGTTIE